MVRRCGDPSHVSYKDYGARGVTVCERWASSFDEFLADMGERPEGMTIERNDSSGNYEPANCRWATTKEQGANRRNVTLVEIDGELMTRPEACARRGISYNTLATRLRRGWTVDEALSTAPVEPSERGRRRWHGK